MWPFNKRKPAVKVEVREIIRTVPINQVTKYLLVAPSMKYNSYYKEKENPSYTAYCSEGFHNKVWNTADEAAEASKGRFLIQSIELVEVESGVYEQVYFTNQEYHL